MIRKLQYLVAVVGATVLAVTIVNTTSWSLPHERIIIPLLSLPLMIAIAIARVQQAGGPVDYSSMVFPFVFIVYFALLYLPLQFGAMTPRRSLSLVQIGLLTLHVLIGLGFSICINGWPGT